MRRKILYTLISIIISNYSFSQSNEDDYSQNEKYYYDFHPLSTLTLGGSFDPNHLDEGKISPLKNIEFAEVDGTGSNQTNFELNLVNTRQQMSSIIQFDTKTSVRYFKVKANARFSFLNSYTFDQNDINLIISAKSEYSRRAIKNYEFTNEAKELISNPKRFRKVYGSRVVTMERLGASFYCIVKISNVSTTMRRKIQADLNVQAKFGPVKANLSSSLRKEFSKASAEKRVDITVVSTADKDGISGLTGFVDAIEGKSDLENIIIEISKYMKRMDAANSKPIGYFTTSINNLGLPKPKISEVLYSERFENSLREVANEYQDVQSELSLINDLLEGKHPAYIYLEDDQPKILRDNIPKLQRALVALAQKQEQLITKYDEIDNPNIARRIANNEKGWLSRWSELFTIEKVELPATAFLNKVSSVLKTSDDNKQIIVKTKKIESITFNIDWIDKDDKSNMIPIPSPKICVSKTSSILEEELFKDAKIKYISADGTADNCGTTLPTDKLYIYNIWGNCSEVKFDIARLQDYFKSDEISNIIDSVVTLPTPLLLPQDNKYSVNIIIKNTLGEIKNIPLGTLYYNKTITDRNIKKEFSIFYFP